MRQFKDRDGRDWQIAIDIGTIKAVRGAGVDLYNLFADEAQRLFADPVLLVDTLWVLCRQQAEQRKLSEVDFARLFEGDALEAAATALLEAVVDFFPSSRGRILRATIEKSEQIAQEMQQKATEAIARLSATDLLRPTASPGSSA